MLSQREKEPAKQGWENSKDERMQKGSSGDESSNQNSTEAENP